MNITVLPGRDYQGNKEQFDKIILQSGDTISIVGATGSGKSAFINDIEVLAQGDTVTGRTVLIDDEIPSDNIIRDPSKKPIALITQNTRVIADLSVGRFLEFHIRARNKDYEELVDKTIDLANNFIGEKIVESVKMTSLSGGQTKALLIADAILISQTPILLLDEIENAGIYQEKLVQLIKGYNKTIIFVTHHPLLAMLTDRRIVMKNGSVMKILETNGREITMVKYLSRIDKFIVGLREKMRNGELLG